MFLGLFLLGCGALAAGPACVIQEAATGAGKCKTGKCALELSGKLYCSQCAEAAEFLIDGKCVASNDVGGVTGVCTAPATADGTCASCASGYFLHQGGCYKIGAAPGNLVCADTAAGATAGVCAACVAGFFKNPAAAAKDACIPCGQTTAVDFNKGVAGCAECTAPKAAGASGNEKEATCTKCVSTKYLKTADDKTTECVEKNACTGSLFPKDDTANGNTCAKCDSAADGGVAECTACTPIASYIRAEAVLVACSACDGGKKVQPDGKGCIASCPDNSEDKGASCECKDGYRPTAAGDTCEEGKPEPSPAKCTIPACKKCSDDRKTCAECEADKYLTPTGFCVTACSELPGHYGATEDSKSVCKQCTVSNCRECDANGKCQTCEDGFYGEACAACDSSCKTCKEAGAEGCTSCPAKTVMTYGASGEAGKCGPECKEGTGEGMCKTCGLSVDGSKYCSECDTADEYPQDGVCGKNTRRAAMCKTGQIANGACTDCEDAYFRMNGGCYQNTRLPGKTVCKTIGTGQCTAPAEGYTLDQNSLVTCSAGCSQCASAAVCTACMDGYYKSGDACTACPAGCSTCTDATACTACVPGYYSDSSSCTKCPSGCLACTKGVSEVMCLLAEPSANQSGLSTGAIAGIAVAAIIVVGGLAGFLAWWFACRGKA